jgi:hypothetical protein
MENPADTLDQADEEILTYTTSDEALEAAAGRVMSADTLASQTCAFDVYFCRPRPPQPPRLR